MNPTEKEMIQKARRGDEEAFREIIRQHEHQVAATIIGILGTGRKSMTSDRRRSFNSAGQWNGSAVIRSWRRT